MRHFGCKWTDPKSGRQFPWKLRFDVLLHGNVLSAVVTE